MTDFVVSHAIRMTMAGKTMFNIFHTLDTTGLITLPSIQSIFRDVWILNLRSSINDSLTFESITSTPLNSLDTRNVLTDTSGAIGAIGGGNYMPTGVHVWLLLQITAFGLRSGGKLIAGLDEGDFSLGVVSQPVLDDITQAGENLRLALAANNSFLAVYHPTYSAPGLPVASLVDLAYARGNSTNNRRRKDFIQ